MTNGASVDLDGYMKTSDYVGSGATGKVRAAETADSATTATSALNATNLNGQPASHYATTAALAPMIQNVTAIQVVSALPTNPVATTLYLVTES